MISLIDYSDGDDRWSLLYGIAPTQTVCRGGRSGKLYLRSGHSFLCRRDFKNKGFRLHVVYKTNQDDRAISLVEAGVGIAIIPRHYASSGIIKIGLTDMETLREIGFEWSNNSNLDEIMRFVDFSKTVPWAN